MATKKAATKKATKKPVKKAVAKKVVQTVGGKNNKQPVTAVKKTAVKKAAATALNPLTPDLALARRIMAHDYVARSKLRIGDTFEVHYLGSGGHSALPKAQALAWRSVNGEGVEFLGINADGLIVTQRLAGSNRGPFAIPVEAVDFSTVDTSDARADTTIKLNNSYSATITRGQADVRVGCQSIPVAKVREVVAAIDEINAPRPARNRAATLGAGGQYTELLYVAPVAVK